MENTIPIHNDEVWNKLSFTKDHSKTTSKWTGKLRGSLTELSSTDGEFLEDIILRQATEKKPYPYDEDKYHKSFSHTVRREDGLVSVSVPEEDKEKEEGNDDEFDEETTLRESYVIQGKLAMIGEAMGFKIWLPKNDRANVFQQWKPLSGSVLDFLPLNYDDTTLRTIEQIDVIWLSGRAIIRAFEVEHTTSIYSGLLRMADLLALQPNMDIKLHIVAPPFRREKVFREIKRPVFSLLEKGPLQKLCTMIPYDSVYELSENEQLKHSKHTLVDEYSERVV